MKVTAADRTARLFTIGYERRSLKELIAQLGDHDIEVLVDVRELPLSRKRGFSKRQLGATVSAFNVRYEHVRELGSPRAIRKRFRQDGDHEAFVSAFRKHLVEQGPVVTSLAELVSEATCCLLCYERHHLDCHRSVVAEEVRQVSDFDVRIVHL